MKKLNQADLHLFLLLIVLIGIYLMFVQKTPQELKPIKLISKDTLYDSNSFSEDKLIHLMNTLEIKHSNVVLAQAKLETGNYTSSRFKESNALFGFQTSDKNIVKYNNWKESVYDYKVWQMKRLRDGEDYYSFLKRVKYASDTNYIPKLKKICIK